MPVISSGVAAAQKNRKKKKVDNSDEHAWIAAFRAETRKLGICESDDEWESDSDDEYDIDAGIAATLSRDDGDRKSSMAVHKYLNQQGRGPTLFQRVAIVSDRLVKNPYFDYFILLCIMVVGVATGIQMHFDGKGGPGVDLFLSMVANITLVVFCLEVVLKILAEGDRPILYFIGDDGSFNRFDFVIVGLSLAFVTSDNGSTIAVMRLLRLLKIMNKIPELMLIVKGLLSGLKAVNNIMLLLVMCTFLFAIAGQLLFGANDPVHFGRVGTAMLTLFQVATLASWGEVYYTAYYGCEQFNAGVYYRYHEGDGVTPTVDPQFMIDANKFTAESKQMSVETKFGEFPGWFCKEPLAQPTEAVVYFYVYTVVTAFVVLSLFISVITTGMFAVISDIKTIKDKEEADAFDSDAAFQRSRDLLADEDSPLREAVQTAFNPDYDPDKKRGCYSKFAAEVKKVADSKWFNGLIISAIGAVAVSEWLSGDGIGDVAILAMIDMAILYLFSAEVVIKVIAEGRWPERYFRDSWNIFDFAIVVISWISAIPSVSIGSIAILRLCRLLRVFKLARSNPGLRAVVEALLSAMKSVGYVMTLILIINYIFAIIGMILFRGNDPMHFDSIAGAMMTVWQCETLDEWEEVLYINMYGCDNYGYFNLAGDLTMARNCKNPRALGWVASMYCVVLVVLGGLVMPTVLIGVISISFEESNKEIMEEQRVGGTVKRILNHTSSWGHEFLTVKDVAKLKNVYEELNTDGRDGLCYEELKPLMEFVTTKYMGSPLADDDLQDMFKVLDVSGDGDLNYAEFLWFVTSTKRFQTTTTGGGGMASRLGGEGGEGSPQTGSSRQLISAKSIQRKIDNVKAQRLELDLKEKQFQDELARFRAHATDKSAPADELRDVSYTAVEVVPPAGLSKAAATQVAPA